MLVLFFWRFGNRFGDVSELFNRWVVIGRVVVWISFGDIRDCVFYFCVIRLFGVC